MRHDEDMNSMDERLSALIDDELSAEETAEMIDRLCSDDALRARWTRLNALNVAFRADGQIIDGESMAQAIMAGIQSESQDVDSGSRVRQLRPVSMRRPSLGTGLALAASALLAAVVIAIQLSPNGMPDSTTQVAVQNTPPAGTSDTTSSESTAVRVAEATPAVEPEPETARRMNAYMINHNAYRGGPGFGGTLGYARVTAYDAAYQPSRR